MLDEFSILTPVAGEPRGLDGRQELGEAGDGVGDGGGHAAEADGDDDGVGDSSVGADEHHAGRMGGWSSFGFNGATEEIQDVAGY